MLIDNMRKIRGFAGMTQTQFALALGVTPVTVSNWERGGAKPHAAAVKRLADLIAVPEDTLRNATVELTWRFPDA